MKLRYPAAIVAALAIAAALAWRAQAPEPVPPATALPVPPSAPAAVVQTPPPTARPGSTPPPSSLPDALLDRTTPLPQLYAELLALAQAGNVEAMHLLASRLHFCTPLRLQALQKSIEWEQAHPPPPRSDENHFKSHAKNIQNYQRRIDECSGVPADAPSGLDWLQRAGELGYGPAQLEYAEQAMGDYAVVEPHEIAEQVEEILRRRDLVRRFMAEAMTHCVPGALSYQAASSAYLFDAADAQAYAISRAAAADAEWREAVAENRHAEVLDTLRKDFDFLARDLNEVSRAAAQRQGEAMYNSCAPR